MIEQPKGRSLIVMLWRFCAYFHCSIMDHPPGRAFSSDQSLITTHNEGWGKVIFLQASVILFTGGSASVHVGMPPPGADPPRAEPQEQALPPKNRPSQEQAPPPKSKHPPEQSMLGDMVNARVVRILLECNLVTSIMVVCEDLV